MLMTRDFLPYKVLEEFPNLPFYLPHQPFGNCCAPPVFCLYQLRSVTDEEHVRSHAQKELAGEIISAGRH